MIKEKDFIVYKTTNILNGKIYVGKSIYNNPKYLGSGSDYFQNTLNKYGRKNFKKEVLEHCKDFKHTCERERYWVLKLNPDLDRGVGYNRAIPNGENCGYEWTDEMKQNASERKKKYYEEHPKVQKKISETTKKYFSNIENRKKASKIRKEYLSNPENKKTFKEQIKNYWSDPKNRKKCGEKSKNYWSNPENKKAQSERKKRDYLKSKKSLKNYWSNLENRKKQSKKTKKYFSDPKNRKKASERTKKYFSDPKNRKKQSNSCTKHYFSKKELYDLYIIQNKTGKEISKYYNCGVWLIYDRLKKYNIKKEKQSYKQ